METIFYTADDSSCGRIDQTKIVELEMKVQTGYILSSTNLEKYLILLSHHVKIKERKIKEQSKFGLNISVETDRIY